MTENKEKALALVADFATVYCSVYNGELMRPAKATFTLHEKKGHFYTIKKKTVISSTGYIQLNKAASVNIVTPKTVVVDGKDENNPYIERHPVTRAIESVAVRKIGIGFSPIGNMTVIDKTLFYNIYTYLIQSIQAKMKAREWKTDKQTRKSHPIDIPLHKDCAFVGVNPDDRPKTGKWIFYLTADPLGIWVNYEHQAILDCLEEHTQRQRFGDRIAQKICERNILRDHPAIGVDSVEPKKNEKGDTIAKVTVYGWRHELTPQNLDDVLLQAEKGAKEIEVKAEVIETTPEEEKQAIAEEEKTDEIKPKAGEQEPPDEYWKKKEAEKAAAESATAQKNLDEGTDSDEPPAKTTKSS